jgi:hypothetical protein
MSSDLTTARTFTGLIVALMGGALMVGATGPTDAAEASPAAPAMSATCTTPPGPPNNCTSIYAPIAAGNYFLDVDATGPPGAGVAVSIIYQGSDTSHNCSPPGVPRLDGNGRYKTTYLCPYVLPAGMARLEGITEFGSNYVVNFTMDWRPA